MDPVFINSLGKFLPGNAVTNDEMAAYLGEVDSHSLRIGRRVLKQNGIRQRHYAIDRAQKSRYRNSEMAALAVADALSRSGATVRDIDLLSAATSQGDVLLPGFASMVHAELGNPSCEISTSHGVCASGVLAMKTAYLQVGSGLKSAAVACASEFPSRLFKSERYRMEDGERARPSFDEEFLRWMLSDGAGAAVLQRHPNPSGISLRVDWIEVKSYADRYDTCMTAGANRNSDGSYGPSWLDYTDFVAAAKSGAIHLKQDLRLVDDVIKVSVDFLLELTERGRFVPGEIDHLVVHYSSGAFIERIKSSLSHVGLRFDAASWFSNLSRVGNTGSASLYLLLEELFYSGRLQPGDRILCAVPESGRFVSTYLHLTAVRGEDRPRQTRSAAVPQRKEEDLPDSIMRRLARVWLDFETDLERVPLVRRVLNGTISMGDYRRLLCNLRQQVVDGSCWIARAVSSMDERALQLRSQFLLHAREEHRDYELLEHDFLRVGGELAEIRSTEKNVGSEALSAWMFHRASQPNPVDLLGAMFIIEGLGQRLASTWAERIRGALGLSEDAVSFLSYHGAADEVHLDRFRAALESPLVDEVTADRIVRSAKVTARLYRLQLEELDVR